jgi:hypothetical protein
MFRILYHYILNWFEKRRIEQEISDKKEMYDVYDSNSYVGTYEWEEARKIASEIYDSGSSASISRS